LCIFKNKEREKWGPIYEKHANEREREREIERANKGPNALIELSVGRFAIVSTMNLSLCPT
jgi:hypothetical protein